MIELSGLCAADTFDDYNMARGFGDGELGGRQFPKPRSMMCEDSRCRVVRD